jgi:hypothetical protein
MFLLALIATTATVGLYALVAILGLAAWPDIALTVAGDPVPQAGMALTVISLLFLLLVCIFLPANARMARLERSHRTFAISMDDVARAYRTAHAAERRGVFALASEFESVRARMDHLRRHPDLAHLEPELLQTAAQMSYESRDLARLYTEDKIDRARAFLRQRQEEAQLFGDRIALARASCDELRRWLTDIEAEERQHQLQVKRLEDDLRVILPLLGYVLEEVRPDGNVVTLPTGKT